MNLKFNLEPKKTNGDNCTMQDGECDLTKGLSCQNETLICS